MSGTGSKLWGYVSDTKSNGKMPVLVVAKRKVQSQPVNSYARTACGRTKLNVPRNLGTVMPQLMRDFIAEESAILGNNLVKAAGGKAS